MQQSELLDNQNGGFTVFAQVISGQDVIDAIVAAIISFLIQVSVMKLLLFDNMPFPGVKYQGRQFSQLHTCL